MVRLISHIVESKVDIRGRGGEWVDDFRGC